MPNVVKCFLDIKEGHYYMFAMVQAFHNDLGETKRWGSFLLGFPKHCSWDFKGLNSVWAKLEPARSKNNEILEINVIQKFTPHTLFYLSKLC